MVVAVGVDMGAEQFSCNGGIETIVRSSVPKRCSIGLISDFTATPAATVRVRALLFRNPFELRMVPSAEHINEVFLTPLWLVVYERTHVAGCTCR